MAGGRVGQNIECTRRGVNENGLCVGSDTLRCSRSGGGGWRGTKAGGGAGAGAGGSGSYKFIVSGEKRNKVFVALGLYYHNHWDMILHGMIPCGNRSPALRIVSLQNRVTLFLVFKKMDRVAAFCTLNFWGCIFNLGSTPMTFSRAERHRSEAQAT